jgi:AcrR family transcriptional regulator
VYRSAQRTAQARDTRQRIVAAATEQFARAGYRATTMRSVAAAAGVSVASIELAFGTKARLLKTAIDVAIAGDHDPVAVLDRDWATVAQETATVRDFLTAVGRTLRPAITRSAGLVLAAYNAADTDPALRALAEQLAAQRATTVAWIIDGIRDRAALRAGITRRHAIDQVWLLMDPAVYHHLTRYRGWSPADYENWFTDTITRLLLD